MREILTIIAGLLVALLTAALVGPYFVDWTARRDAIEARLSHAVGEPVHIDGDIDLVLLPTPRLVLNQVHFGTEGPGEARVAADRATFELAVPPLLHGEFRFTNVLVEAPRLRVTLGSDGAFALPHPATGTPRDIRFEKIDVRGGSIVVQDPGHDRSVEILGIDLTAEGETLVGPYKGAGSWASDPWGTARKQATAFRFATGAPEDGRVRLKMSADGSDGFHADLDGAIGSTAGAASTTRLSYAGAATLAGTIDIAANKVPVRATGDLTLDPSRAVLDNLSIRSGIEDRAPTANGRAEASFDSPPAVKLDLAARQFDLDRLLASDREAGTAPRRFADVLGGLIATPPFGTPTSFSFAARLTSPAVVLAGETLGDARVELRLAPGAQPGLDIEASGPGRSHIVASGFVESGSAAAFRGQVEAGASDLPRLREWLATVLPGAAADLAPLPFRSFEAAGAVELSGASLSGRGMTLRADRSTLTGALSLTRAVGSEPARIYADLQSDALDLDGVPNLSDALKGSSGVDLSLALDARAVRVARFGEGMIDAGRIGVRLTKSGADVRLERLSIENIGGAGVTATGAMTASGATLDGSLQAARLGDLAELVRRVAPGPLAAGVVARATALSPARFTFHADAQRDTRGDLVVSSLTLGGSARGTTIDARATPGGTAGDEITVTATLDNPEAPTLLRQIGLDTLPLTSLGRAHVVVGAHGQVRSGFDARLQANLAGTDLRFGGRVTLASDGRPSATGNLHVTTADAAPLVQVLAVMLPDANSQRIAADLQANLSATSTALQFSAIGGTFLGGPVSGDLTIGAPSDPASSARATVTGALQVERLSLPVLAAFALGPPQPARASALWSETPFGAALADPPDVSIDLRSRKTVLSDQIAGDAGALHLGLSAGVVSLDDIGVSLGDGTLSGKLSLRRDKASASVAGEIGVTNVLLQTGTLRGRATGTAQISATGANPAALVAALAGRGTVRIDGFEVPRTAPDALPRLVAASDEDGFALDETSITNRLAGVLDRGPLSLGTRRLDLGLATGIARLTPLDTPATLPGNMRAQVSATLDLRTLTVDLRTSLEELAAPKDWKDAKPPQLGIVWHGPLAAPRREIEAGGLIGGLTARAIARESARIEAFDADVRERAFFSRRLKGLQYMQQRDREIAAFEAEQVRKAEADRLAAEAAVRDAARAEAQARERQQKERDLRQVGPAAGASSAPATLPPLPPVLSPLVPMPTARPSTPLLLQGATPSPR